MTTRVLTTDVAKQLQSKDEENKCMTEAEMHKLNSEVNRDSFS